MLRTKRRITTVIVSILLSFCCFASAHTEDSIVMYEHYNTDLHHTGYTDWAIREGKYLHDDHHSANNSISYKFNPNQDFSYSIVDELGNTIDCNFLYNEVRQGAKLWIALLYW